MSAEHILQEGLDALGLTPDCTPFMRWLDLLARWNRTWNLTAITSAEHQITHHILDSLAILPLLHGTKILDAGSGAGLPGIMLAIARPDLDVVLLDSNGKKTRFLTEARRVLGLHNTRVIHARAEAWHSDERFDTVTCRALCTLEQLVGWTAHLVAENGIWLAMKGQSPDEEIAALTRPCQTIPYGVPGLDATRCAVRINNVRK